MDIMIVMIIIVIVYCYKRVTDVYVRVHYAHKSIHIPLYSNVVPIVRTPLFGESIQAQ